jgi:WD40 repeat protein
MKFRKDMILLRKQQLLISIFLVVISVLLMAPSSRNFSQGIGQYQEVIRLGIGEIDSADWNPTQNKIAVSTNLGVYLYNEDWQLLKFASFPQFLIKSTYSKVHWSHDGSLLTLTREIEDSVDGDFPGFETVILDNNLNLVGQKLRHLHNEVKWSPDSTRFAIPQRNGFKIWNRDGQPVLTIPTGDPDYSSFTTSLVWSLEGQQIITLQETGRIQTWNATVGTLLFQYDHQNKQEWIFSIESSSEGSQIAVGALNGDVYIRDSASFQIISILRGHTAQVYKMIWKGNRLATASEDGTVRVWNITNLSTSSVLNSMGASRDILSADSQLSKLIADPDIDSISLYDISTGQKISGLQPIVKDGVDATWKPNGSEIVVPGDNELIFFDAISGVQTQRIQLIPISPRSTVVWSPDGSMIAIMRNPITVWRVLGNSVQLQNQISLGDTFPSAVTWNPSGSQVAIIDSIGAVRIWDVSSGTMLTSFQTNREGGDKIAWSPDGNRFATTSSGPSSSVIIWDTTSWTLLTELKNACCFDWSPDGTKIAISHSNDIRLYDSTYINYIVTLAPHPTNTFSKLEWNPDSRSLAATGEKYDIYLWDINNPTASFPIQIIPIISDFLSSFTWSPDGSRLLLSLTHNVRIFARNGTSTPSPTPTSRSDSPAIYRPVTATFHFPTLPSVTFGNPNDHPITGDWDGDGVDTLGVFDPLAGRFLLRNSNTPGAPDLSFLYGNPGDIPLTGHWTATATHDGVGTYRNTNGTMYLFLRNQLSTGYADLTAIVGNPGDLPVVGDWNGDGVDTVGLYRPDSTTFYLFNRNAPDMEVETQFTLSGGVPIAGRWTGSGGAGVGFFADGVFSLKDTLESGTFDRTVNFGETGDVPLAGRWSP